MTTTVPSAPPGYEWVRARGPWFGAILALALTALLSGAAVFVLGVFGTTPVITWRDSHDPGVRACLEMRDAKADGRQAADADVELFAESSEPHLRHAGNVLTPLAGLPSDQLLAHFADEIGAESDIAAGCAVVGVTFPPGTFAS
jgi:hypothetical protein